MRVINLMDIRIILLASLVVMTKKIQIALVVCIYDFPFLLVCEIKWPTFIDYASNLRSVFPVQENLEFTIFDRPCVLQINVIIYNNFYFVKMYAAVSQSTQGSH